MSNLTNLAEQFITASIPQRTAVETHEYLNLSHRLPEGVNVQDAIDYGFYEYKYRYFIRRKEEYWDSISNFTMKVLYLIQGVNPKRIVELTNVHNRKIVIDFGVDELISIEKFKTRIESNGNFLFDGRPADLSRIKNKLFQKEKASIEINRLGRNKNMFVFANGIYDNGKWNEIDKSGFVELGADHYYIPVLGNIQSEDNDDLRNYRRFAHTANDTSFAEWSKQIVTVYGDNGILGIAFVLYALYSDIIFDKTKAAPMLYLYGQRGSGKGTMANSLLHLFGHPQDPIMLGGASTVVGFMRKLGQFSNAVVWLDEYKNDIGDKKIESIKNIWDRVGYERGVKDSSNRTQSTPVTSSAMVSGQEIPNVEPALFSRFCLLEFKNAQHTPQQIGEFNRLRKMESDGVTNATLTALCYREKVMAEFKDVFDDVANTLRNTFKKEVILERQFVNYAILISISKVLGSVLNLPYELRDIIRISDKYILAQHNMMKTANEVQQFFEMVHYLLSIKLIVDGEDVQVTESYVKIRMSKIIPLYREHGKRQGMRVLESGTLKNYMENSDAYLKGESEKSAHRFKRLQVPTRCKVFDYTSLKTIYGVDFKELIDGQLISDETGDETPF